MGNLCCQYTGCAWRRHPGLQNNLYYRGSVNEGLPRLFLIHAYLLLTIELFMYFLEISFICLFNIFFLNSIISLYFLLF